MGNINFINGIVKILELPKQKNFYMNNILVAQVRVQFSQIRNKRVVNLIFYNKLAHDILNYYKINDYILIEGYFSVQKLNEKLSTFKKFNITVLKIHPVQLNSTKINY